MGNSRDDETVGVTPHKGSIEVRFKIGTKTYSPRLRMKPNAANLQYANRLRREILAEHARGTLDLLKHFPRYKFAAKLRSLSSKTQENARNFGDWYNVWVSFAERELEHSTLAIYKRHMLAYWLPEFRDMMPASITHEMLREHLANLARDHLHPNTGKPVKGLGRKTQNNIMIPLRGVFALICKHPSTLANPCEGIENLDTQQPEPDPFSMAELALALAKVRELYDEELADYFAFAAFAGLRVSEQIALTWEDVDLLCLTARVRQVRVMKEDKKRTKTKVARTVELNSRAAAVILRQRDRTQASGGRVFRNPVTGNAWSDTQVQSDKWMRALRACGVRQRAPKELRDTSVTIALSSGANPYYVATQHGHDIRVMMKSYAKWIPDADRGRNREAINQALLGESAS